MTVFDQKSSICGEKKKTLIVRFVILNKTAFVNFTYRENICCKSSFVSVIFQVSVFATFLFRKTTEPNMLFVHAQLGTFGCLEFQQLPNFLIAESKTSPLISVDAHRKKIQETGHH